MGRASAGRTGGARRSAACRPGRPPRPAGANSSRRGVGRQVHELRGHQVVRVRRPAARRAGRRASTRSGRAIWRRRPRRAPRRALQRGGGDVDRGDLPAALGQPDRVGALAAADVQRPARAPARRPRRPAAGSGRPLQTAGWRLVALLPGRPRSNIVRARCAVGVDGRRAVSSATRSALIAAAAVRPGRGRRDHLGAQVGDVAGHPHARAPRSRRSGRRRLAADDVAAASPPRPARARATRARSARAANRGATTSASSATTSPSSQPDPGQRVVVDLQRRRPRRRRRRCRGRPSCSASSRVRRRAACAGTAARRAPLPPQQRLVHRHRPGGQDADPPVADLPAVAVRAVQHVAAPALGQAGHVGQLVDEPGGHQQPPRPHAAAVVQRRPGTPSPSPRRRDRPAPATTSPP